jgi:hypothetical protein
MPWRQAFPDFSRHHYLKDVRNNIQQQADRKNDNPFE